MASFSIVDVDQDTASTQIENISDIELVTIGGSDYLLVASESLGAITSYEIGADGSLTRVDDQGLTADSGTFVLSHLNVFTHNGETLIAPGGRWDDELALIRFTSTGQFSTIIDLGSVVADLSRFELTETVFINNKTFLFGAQADSGSLVSFRVVNTLNLWVKPTLQDTDQLFLGDISAIESAQVRNKKLLFVASALDSGIEIFTVDKNGNLHYRSQIAPGDGSGFSQPSDLTTVEVSGKTYLIVASAQSSSLTVWSVSPHGVARETAHLIDSLGTRFANANVLESFEYGGRSFVFAAGNDDGITLLEVLPGGILVVVAVLEDDFDTTLKDVSDIEVNVVNDDIFVYVSSHSEDGVTTLKLDLGDLGDIFEGDNTSQTIIGTAGDDVLFGGGRRDWLYGEDGNDRLIDGRGSDFLYGGAGADIFQFVPDGKRDVVVDFEYGIDKIDLSLFDGIGSIRDIKIRIREDLHLGPGLTLIIGDENIRLVSHDGQPMPKLTADDFIF